MEEEKAEERKPFEIEWEKLGRGVKYRKDEHFLILKVDTRCPEGGWPESKTEKSWLVANSGGWQHIPEFKGLQVNFTARVPKM